MIVDLGLDWTREKERELMTIGTRVLVRCILPDLTYLKDNMYHNDYVDKEGIITHVQHGYSGDRDFYRVKFDDDNLRELAFYYGEILPIK